MFKVSAKRRLTNFFATGLIGLATLIVLLPLFLILGRLVADGVQAIDWNFFTQLPKPVGEKGGGVAQAIVGTIILIILSSIIGICFGIGTGVYVSEFKESKLAKVVRLVSDVLSGIPAIVMGLVVYGLFVVTFGFSAMAGGMALGFLMIPIVVRTTEEVLRLVPQNLREAGFALGLPKWRVTLSIVLPAARSGIITGVMLGVARVSGEAAPLIFTALGNDFWNLNLGKPIGALPLVIYQYSTSPFEEWHRLASAAALVLVGLILLTTLLARSKR